MTCLRILHISDLHAGKEVSGNNQWRARLVLGEAWQRNLHEVAADGPVDIVCFTGDLAQSGKAEEYLQAGEFLRSVLDVLGLDASRLFVVPGNHDCHRDTRQPEWAALRAAIDESGNAKGVGAWMGGSKLPFGFKAEWRDAIHARQEAYRDWLKAFGLEHCLPGPVHPLGWRYRLDASGTPLHLVGLNSAWLAGDDNDAGKLRLTDDQLGRLLTDSYGNRLDGPAVVLLHHPPGEVADGKDARRLFAQYGAALILHGHVHEPDYQRWQHPNHPAAPSEAVAGCLYEHNTFPNCFQLIDIDCTPAGLTPRQVWLRSWSNKSFHWYDDNQHYANSRNGRLRFDPPARRAPPPVRGALFGRDDEIEALRRAFLPAAAGERDFTPVAIQCAIEGMPGVGKTRLAETFIADHWAPAVKCSPSDSRVHLVLRADSPADAEALAREATNLLKLDAPGEQLWPALAARLQHGPTLLLIENVDTPELAAAVGALAGQLHDCPLLITARQRGLGRTTGWPRVEVPPLTPQAALALLRSEAPACPATDDALLDLARQLGHLPLALHIAASHLADGSTPALFLAELRQHGFDLPPADAADPRLQVDRARAILHSSFALSWQHWQRLQAGAPAIRDGLAALAHGPTAGCGTSLGAAIAGLGGTDYDRLLRDAARWSLAEVAPSTARVRLHPLLAEWLRGEAPAARNATEARWQAWLVARLPANATDPAAQGCAWGEVRGEPEALVEWLERCPLSLGLALAEAGLGYAQSCGPFGAWQALCTRLLAEVAADDPALSNLWWTLGQVAHRAGDLDAALAAADAKQAFDKGRGNEREAALAANLRADILTARGKLDEALRIRTEEELPVYEKLGDVRSKAVTQGKIADILMARGELDEALRIRTEEELPVYEKLGDVRSKAVTQGKIADILMARGEFDEALRILSAEVQPAFEKLGDVSSKAVTQGKIADILTARGELDEALRIRTEEELPVYEKLGNVREKAVTQGQIADILMARGELNEALRIRTEEELPVYEKLGDVYSKAVTQGQIADILMARGELDEALRIRTEEELPVYEKLGDVRSKAVTQGKIADILMARGEFDEALRIRTEEQLPVYEKLGDVRELLVARAKIGFNLLTRNAPGDRAEARRLFDLALADARRLKLPQETAAIESWLKRLDDPA